MEERINLYLLNGNYPQVLDISETINLLRNHRLSLARYGDGEFNIIGGRSIYFQKYSSSLADELYHGVKNPNSYKRCLVAIPFLQFDDTDWWNKYWFYELRFISKLISKKYTYGNMGVTRQIGTEGFVAMKALWQHRDVIFVYGNGSRFQTDHELFSNVKSRESIVGLPLNSYEVIDELANEITQKAMLVRDPLILISLGPTATAIVLRLQNELQLIDIGHITSVYDRLMYGKPVPEKLEIE